MDQTKEQIQVPTIQPNIGADFDKNESESGKGKPRTLLAGTVFGAIAGMLSGGVVGAACCWLTESFDFIWHGAVVGVFAGLVAGALIGFKERKSRGDLVRPDIATIVAVIISLLPSLLMILQGFGGVGGSFSLYLLVGLLFVGPAIGFLIGGILDRAFETFLHRSWSKALAQAVIGVGLCVGLLFAIDAAAYGPSPIDAAREARAVLVRTWRERDNLRGAKVRDVTLTRSGRWTYTGFVDVTIAGIQERMKLDVEIKDGMVSAQWRSLEE